MSSAGVGRVLGQGSQRRYPALDHPSDTLNHLFDAAAQLMLMLSKLLFLTCAPPPLCLDSPTLPQHNRKTSPRHNLPSLPAALSSPQNSILT